MILAATVMATSFGLQAADLEQAVLDEIAALDSTSGSPDTIDPGIETEALVRYANDKILRKYDKNHDGKVESAEALAFAKDNLSPVSETELERVYTSAYEKAERNFDGGVPADDIKAIRRKVPFVPRTRGFKFGLDYGLKDESTKEVETIGGTLEYTWGGSSLVSVPFELGTKLTYGKENTFVGSNADKIERWTLQPVGFVFGTDDWFAKPILGLGYGRTRNESIDGTTVTNERDKEFVWEFGLDFPIRMTDKDSKHRKIASIKMTNTVRFDEVTSGKRSEQLKIGFSIGVNEFKTLRAMLSE